GGGDGHRLEGSDDIREPQAHELHPALLDGAEDEVPLLVHAHSSPPVSSRPPSQSSSSAQARDRSRSTSGARAASASVSKGPMRSEPGEAMPNSTSPVDMLYQYFSLSNAKSYRCLSSWGDTASPIISACNDPTGARRYG